VSALPRDFYARPVLDVAPDLVGCVLRHGGSAGLIVETEAYHESEPACHAFSGLTARTEVLFGPPGHAYVYRSYGIHALINVVTDREGEGAAVLIRALEPLDGIDAMRGRRGLERLQDLCSGPGKLTQALGIGLELNGSPFDGALSIEAPPPNRAAPALAAAPRVGITRAVELEWRFCDARSRCVSRPLPPAMRHPRWRASERTV
jgi:DNA-3-methyladenine glycosylase